ncbi:MAG: glycosyltransferase 87 family protein [Bdellovibrionota bacterium]
MTRALIWKTIWSVLGLGFLVLFVHRAWHGPHSDAQAYYHAGVRALHGEPLYVASEAWPFKYLPAISFLFVPYGLLPYDFARVALMLTELSFCYAIYWRTARGVGNAAALALAFGMFRFHNVDLLNFQVNGVILGLLLLAWSRYRSKALGGGPAALAVAVQFKVLPILLLPGIWFSGRRRFLGMTLAWGGGAALLAALALGWHSYLEWYGLMKMTTPWPAPLDSTFQSIPAAIWWWSRAGFDPRFFDLAMKALFGAAIAASIFPFFRARAKLPMAQQAVAYSAILSLTVLFSPLAWKHHYVLFFPAYLVLVSRRLWREYWIVVFLMSILPSILKKLDDYYGRDWGNNSFLCAIGGLVCWGILMDLLYRRSPGP